MKPIHECAVIKDKNKRVAYFVECNNQQSEGFKPWTIVEHADFEKLVQDKKVKYLIWDDDRIKCKYTYGELKSLGKKFKFNEKWVSQSQNNYWDMDVTFKYKHIMAAMQNKGLACSVLSAIQTFKVYTVQIIVYGNSEIAANMVNDLGNIVGKPLNMYFKPITNEVGTLALLWPYCKTLLDELADKYNLMFDVSTLVFYAKNDIEMPKITFMQGKNEKNMLLYIASQFANATLKTEKKILIR